MNSLRRGVSLLCAHSNDNLMMVCRYAPHFGSVKPFMYSKEGLPGMKKDFPGEGPLKDYLAAFKEVKDFGAAPLQGHLHCTLCMLQCSGRMVSAMLL
jgi:hypothetical protein